MRLDKMSWQNRCVKQPTHSHMGYSLFSNFQFQFQPISSMQTAQAFSEEDAIKIIVISFPWNWFCNSQMWREDRSIDFQIREIQLNIQPNPIGVLHLTMRKCGSPWLRRKEWAVRCKKKRRSCLCLCRYSVIHDAAQLYRVIPLTSSNDVRQFKNNIDLRLLGENVCISLEIYQSVFFLFTECNFLCASNES